MITAIVAWLVSQPVIRQFLMELFLKLFSELLTGSNADPAFRTQFYSLAGQLAAATTEEEKRRVLSQLKDLRPGS